jgi:hypothetical protein
VWQRRCKEPSRRGKEPQRPNRKQCIVVDERIRSAVRRDQDLQRKICAELQAPRSNKGLFSCLAAPANRNATVPTNFPSLAKVRIGPWTKRRCADKRPGAPRFRPVSVSGLRRSYTFHGFAASSLTRILVVAGVVVFLMYSLPAPQASDRPHL